ncbi:hypothetical protein [Candidatus Frankia nodulisporulans]|uniref:hypothetical protein n=1 Tax=Candidatus Frankia nodulisporulans TaxID=2060052 RepID=UPI0013D363F9|nr:hypothetical protein [Candidatus Frankia nodulisporulans]
MTDEQVDRRSYARSARMELLMSPELKERIRAAAAADGRRALPWVLEVLERALPPELDLTDGEPAQEASMAS